MSAREQSVRRMIAAFSSDDTEALRQCLHPEITVRRPLPDVGIPASPSNVGSYHGLEEVLRALTELQRTTQGIEVEVRRLEDVGENSVLFEFIASMGPAEERMTWLGWSLFGFRDDLIVSTETFGTEAAARESIAASN